MKKDYPGSSITRRDFLKTSAVFGALSLMPGVFASAGNSRRNVLLLIVDDLNTWLLDDTNRYTGKVVAPNIRRLAESGVLFNRAPMQPPHFVRRPARHYCPESIPGSRASMRTG